LAACAECDSTLCRQSGPEQNAAAIDVPSWATACPPTSQRVAEPDEHVAEKLARDPWSFACPDASA
jgi:hypothetical protein